MHITESVNQIQLYVQGQKMGGAVLSPQYLFNFPSGFPLSQVKQLHQGKPLYSLQDRHLSFTSWEDQLSVSSTKSDRNREGKLPQRSTTAGRKKKEDENKNSKKEDENKNSQSFDGRLPISSNQDKVIALFRRIRSSISKGESTITKKKNPNSSEKSSIESLLEILHQSRKPVKEVTKNKRGEKPTRKQDPPKGKKTTNDAQYLEPEFKLTRPPSNFIKRSPIPSPSTHRENTVDLKHEEQEVAASNNELKSPKLEEMKVPELRELAKSRGMKGYSKLKKGELLELLQS